MERSLRQVHPDAPSGAEVRCSIALERGVGAEDVAGPSLVARFRVVCAARHVNPAFPREGSPWGLWDWDVVELFVRARADGPYHEFQVSPLGQGFELEVFEPRRRFNRDFRSGFRREARETADGWEGLISVPLSSLGWDGREESIQGNAFAILGAEPRRVYFSLFLERQEKPDFHLPEKFRPLLG